MNKQVIIDKLKNKGINNIKIDEEMKKHTTFKIGGKADIIVYANEEINIVDTVEIAKNENIPLYIMGNGSNLLVRDGGLRGIVLKIGEGYNHIELKGNEIICQAGASLTAISRFALKNSLKGFEFANGIPGTIGGGVIMNAGAYGGELKDVVKRVRLLDGQGQVLTFSGKEMEFRYRGSKALDEGLIVLTVEIQLEKGNEEEIKDNLKHLTKQRTSKQPLDLPSAGSTFKRPEGYFAAKLIDDANLKGLSHRGAQVSNKHCGFIVNTDNARAKDVLDLVDTVKKVVMDKFKVELEMEIKVIGED